MVYHITIYYVQPLSDLDSTQSVLVTELARSVVTCSTKFKKYGIFGTPVTKLAEQLQFRESNQCFRGEALRSYHSASGRGIVI